MKGFHFGHAKFKVKAGHPMELSKGLLEMLDWRLKGQINMRTIRREVKT